MVADTGVSKSQRRWTDLLPSNSYNPPQGSYGRLGGITARNRWLPIPDPDHIPHLKPCSGQAEDVGWGSPGKAEGRDGLHQHRIQPQFKAAHLCSPCQCKNCRTTARAPIYLKQPRSQFYINNADPSYPVVHIRCVVICVGTNCLAPSPRPLPTPKVRA